MSAKSKPKGKAAAKQRSCVTNEDEIPGSSTSYEVDLSCRNLKVVKGLDKFKNLRILNMSSNAICKLEGLSGNKELRELKVHSNRIQGELSGLGSLSQLVHLMLQFNQIESLGTGLNQLSKLQLLRVDSNLLREVAPGNLRGLVSLGHLDLSHNRLVRFSCGSELPSLVHLNLSYNQLRAFPQDITACHKLEELDVSGNPLEDDIKPIESLKVLSAGDMEWSGVEALRGLKALQELHLPNSRLASVQGLAQYCPSLTTLDLRGNHLDSLTALEELKDLPQLEEIHMEGNPLEYDRAQLQALAPNLVAVDGDGQVARQPVATPTSRPVTPAARPVTPVVGQPGNPVSMAAMPLITLRKMEEELAEKEKSSSSVEQEIQERFSSLFLELDHLGDHSPPPPTTTATRPFSRASSRARIHHAMQFAEHMASEPHQHFTADTAPIPDN